MKKFTLLFAFAALLVGQTWAQCTPNPIWVFAGLPGIWPNATIGLDSLPNGTKGVAYSPGFGGNTLTVVVPADTTIDLSSFGLPGGVVTVSIDAMSIGTVSGLPSGMTSACNSGTCSWPGDTSGCIIFTGTPAASGDYNVDVPLSITFLVPIIGTPFTTPAVPVSYRLHIDPNVAIDELNMSSFSADRNAPNPFSTTSTVRYNMVHSGSVQFEVVDLAGNQVQARTLEATAGLNELTIDATGLAAGIYLYHLSDGESVITRKMTVVK
jgi:hypothetical protein